MERLVINVPKRKSFLVKQVLHGLGVSVEGYQTANYSDYRDKLLQTTVWTDEELKVLEDAKLSFGNWNKEEW